MTNPPNTKTLSGFTMSIYKYDVTCFIELDDVSTCTDSECVTQECI